MVAVVNASECVHPILPQKIALGERKVTAEEEGWQRHVADGPRRTNHPFPPPVWWRSEVAVGFCVDYLPSSVPRPPPSAFPSNPAGPTSPGRRLDELLLRPELFWEDDDYPNPRLWGESPSPVVVLWRSL